MHGVHGYNFNTAVLLTLRTCLVLVCFKPGTSNAFFLPCFASFVVPTEIALLLYGTTSLYTWRLRCVLRVTRASSHLLPQPRTTQLYCHTYRPRDHTRRAGPCAFYAEDSLYMAGGSFSRVPLSFLNAHACLSISTANNTLKT